MLKKRIIPCLDIQGGRTVKGVNFKNIVDAGDPVELAKRYAAEGADELVFLDISATIERRNTMLQWVESVAESINIPFTVGGGISTISDVEALLQAGADKVSVNSAAVRRPELLTEIATRFGSQCLVLAIDTQRVDGIWKVFTKGGREATELRTLAWAKKGAQLGAGEILLTSMNNDGTKNGFALDITGQIAAEVNVPIIASGGAGRAEDFKALFTTTEATAGLAASIFHYGELPVSQLKNYLKIQNISVR